MKALVEYLAKALAREPEKVVVEEEHFGDRVKLFGFGQMTDIAGMQHECRCDGQCVDFVDCCLECADHVSISRLVEAHVTVTDLDKTQLGLDILLLELRETAEAIGLKDSALDQAEGSSSCPGHAF